MNNMKTIFIIILILCSHLCFANDELCLDLIREYGDELSSLNEWEQIPLSNGTFMWLNKTEIEASLLKAKFLKRSPKCSSSKTSSFALYTKSNKKDKQILKTNDLKLLRESNFNPDHPTRIIIHGWLSSGKAKLNKLIRDAYLKIGEFNIIVVDWSSLASSLHYMTVRYGLKPIAKQIAFFIAFLHKAKKIPYDSVYMIGHSLGAHLAGYTGKYLGHSRKVGTIYGLDPAHQLFNVYTPKLRLSITDAKYVETIHTNTGYYGFTEPIGTTSFYPNGGKFQPGCDDFDFVSGCSHGRSYEYFAESVELGKHNKFIPTKCRDCYEAFSTRHCEKTMKSVKMGGEPSNTHKPNGIYSLSTNSKKPYGRG